MTRRSTIICATILYIVSAAVHADEPAHPSVGALKRLEAARAYVKQKNLTFRVRYSRVGELPLALVTGLKIPADVQTKVKQKQPLGSKPAQARGVMKVSAKPTDASFDWRDYYDVTPVRD